MSSGIEGLARAGDEIESIPVHINFDIIRLFSEGLYRSPHKAIEELVSNAYDAEARRVHVLLPEQPDDPTAALAPLWVIDDGRGMDAGGFRQLWRVAESNKKNVSSASNGRLPIGQFGIGKLAAYVLARKLTHLSRVDDKLLLTIMDFRTVTGRQAEDNDPVRISLRRVDEATARQCLAEIKHRDPSAWKLMFGDGKQSRTWTAAGMSDFKDLYGKLSTGTLRWVLSTGLPLHGNFKIRLNGRQVASSKERLPEIKSLQLDDDLAGIGRVTGTARIFEKQLTTGKSEQAGRSHGFFIRVRGRVINLEDELFGVEALNHAAWSRFVLEVDADGLREHLLSSREGVRDSEEVGEFRQHLRKTFNRCRTAYDEWEKSQNDQLDLLSLSENPSPRVTEPLLRGVRKTVETGSESFYIEAPKGVADENRSDWLATYEDEASAKPFDRTEFLSEGPHAPAIRYDPVTRCLVVNRDHPFVDKLTGGGRHRNPATLFASSEVLLECQLQDQGIDRGMVADVLRDRDDVLRLMAGDAPHTAVEVRRLLQVANQDRNALERATGVAFRVLGFEYEPRGGAASGPDGILVARLGRHKTLADYKVVYDAKQTHEPSVPADKIDFASLEDFRRTEQADFGFFIAAAYASEMNPDGALNRRIEGVTSCRPTLLKIEHLRRLVWLHYKFGVTLTELRSLFEDAHTVREVNDWIGEHERVLHEQVVPLRVLLEELESEKSDIKAVPNVKVVRSKRPDLKKFEPERLIARLKAVETILGPRWIGVGTPDSYDVIMHHTADQLLAQFERAFNELGGEAD